MTITWSNEQTDDAILGSGALSYPWYSTYRDLKDAEGNVIGAILGMMDPKDDDKFNEYSVKYSQMRTATRAIVAGKHNVSDRIVGYIKDDDLDSDAADCVLQVCAYGSVVFS